MFQYLGLWSDVVQPRNKTITKKEERESRNWLHTLQECITREHLINSDTCIFLFCFEFFSFWPLLAMLRAYTWLCSRVHIECQGLKLGQQGIRQALYSLYGFFGPNTCIFKRIIQMHCQQKIESYVSSIYCLETEEKNWNLLYFGDSPSRGSTWRGLGFQEPSETPVLHDSKEERSIHC